MASYGRFPWGVSDSLGDQALELMAAMDKWMNQYLESNSYQNSLSYMDESDKELLESGFELMKHFEKFLIDEGACLDRIDHKLRNIEGMVAEIYTRSK